MDLVDLIVEKRDDIKRICAKYGADSVRIFGSCARNDYNEDSDIDILVKMPEDLSGFKWAGRLGDLEDELNQLLGVTVEVIDETCLKGRTRERILKEAVSL